MTGGCQSEQHTCPTCGQCIWLPCTATTTSIHPPRDSAPQPGSLPRCFVWAPALGAVPLLAALHIP
jgi:hypothetical protein